MALTRLTWLLLLPLPLFVLVVAGIVAGLAATGVEQAADLTPGQLRGIAVPWTLEWLAWAAALLLGCAGHAGVVARMAAAPRLAAAARVALALCAATSVAMLALQVGGGLTTDAATWGSSAAYLPALVLSYASVWAGLAALALTGAGLRRSGLRRRLGTGLLAAAAALLLLDVVTRGVPPFALAVLWAVTGVAVLRRPLPSPA